MDILGVGPIELLVVLAIAMIFVGPERLPEIARAIGKVYRQIHDMSRLVTAQWQEELSAAAQLDPGTKSLTEALTQPLQAARADAERALTAPLTAILDPKQDTNSPPAGASVPSSAAATAAPTASDVPVPASAPAPSVAALSQIAAPGDGDVPAADVSPQVPQIVSEPSSGDSGDGDRASTHSDNAPAAAEAEIVPSEPTLVTSLTKTQDGNPDHGDQ